MKLRFVADSKDVLIFILFAIFLLYIVALAVLNIPQLAGEGTFYGLNPFLAFSPEYLKYTIVIYLVFLAGLFFSVKSYFFETKKGIGFGIKSGAEGGYSDWAKEKDIKNDSQIKKILATDVDSEYAGVPLISNGRELWVDNGEYHSLVIGATGSGKTQSTILPTIKILAKKRESIVCTDPKGEVYEKAGGLLKQRGYNIILLNFRNPQNGNAWNPLSLPYKLYKNGNQDKAIELLDDLALNILYDESNANSDPFWEKSAADYFAGIALAMFEDTTEDKININSINLTATVGEDKFGGSTYIKEYFNYKDPASSAYINASGTVMAPSDTKGGIISVFKQKVKLFATRENLSEMLSYSDFELDSIGKQPTAVFIIIQDEKKTYHSLATIFVKQVYETLIDVAQQSGGKLPVRTNFLLDEFANMPPLKDVTTMITAARSRQIRFTMIIQNFAQLNKIYGKDDAETIKGNCGNIIYLISTELAALEEISKLCGEKKSKKDDKTASTPLATVSDLQRMKQFDQIVLRMRKNPFKTSFVPDFKINWGKCTSPKVDYPTREKKEVQVFDIRDFVKSKKNQKINEMMANMSSSNSTVPVGRPMMPSPFESFSKPNKDVPDLSVNDLVKKIDAKLAEIEKEEQEQKKKKMEQENKKNEKEKEKIDVVEVAKEEKIKEDKKIDTTKREPSNLFSENKFNDKFEFSAKKNKNEYYDYNDIELLEDDINNFRKKPVLSSSYIENKVNSKLADELINDIDDNFDILEPIDDNMEKSENNSSSSNIKDAVIEPKISYKAELKPYFESNNTSVKPKIEINDRDEIEHKSNTEDLPSENTKLFKPTATIKLEDVGDDDEFFDDFFED